MQLEGNRVKRTYVVPASTTGSPEIIIGDGWVAVRWHEKGAYQILHEDGSIRSRWSVPTNGNALS